LQFLLRLLLSLRSRIRSRLISGSALGLLVVLNFDLAIFALIGGLCLLSNLILAAACIVYWRRSRCPGKRKHESERGND